MGISVPESFEQMEENMSLLEDFARPCVLLEKTCVPDGAGGQKTTWSDGAEFKNYLALDTSMEARRAEKDGVKSVYSALVKRDFAIKYGDYFKDKLTDTTYRVTSNPDEKKVPQSSMLDLKFFIAERKEVPT